MKSILITGCNRGLGLGLIRNLLKKPQVPEKIIATCRSVEKAKELQALAEKHNNIHIIEIDLLNFDKYDGFVGQVEEITKTDGLNVLFNNAGAAPKSTRISFVNENELLNAFKINTVIPILLTKALLPLLKLASKNNPDKSMGIERAAIINMSSMLGSIELNTNGGLYEYRTSKTALNAATKSMSIDLKSNKILVISLHPGWVRTDMGGAKAPLDVDDSCGQIIDTIYKLNESDNGTFVQYHGQDKLPW